MLVFSLFVCVSCFAQEKTAVPQSAQPEAGIRMIYEYKAELGLTDKQEGDLKKILGDFQVYFTEKKKALTALQIELNEMIKNKEDLKKIRKQFEEMAAIQVDASCFDVETSRKVDGVVTPEQMAKWRAIQANFQFRQQELMKEAQANQATAEAKQ